MKPNTTISLIIQRFKDTSVMSDPANPFASLIYAITSPFLWMFQDLPPTPAFEDIQIEFFF